MWHCMSHKSATSMTWMFRTLNLMYNFHCSVNKNLRTFIQIYCRSSVVSPSSPAACSEHLYDIAWKCLEMFLHRVCFMEVFMYLNEDSCKHISVLVLNWRTRRVNQSDLQAKEKYIYNGQHNGQVQTWFAVPSLPQRHLTFQESILGSY